VHKATIVYNPNARNAPRPERLAAAANSLKTDSWQVDIVVTESANHATELALTAAKYGAEVVFACGGDGTVNEVVNGLTGTPAALGLVRGGMGDVFAKEIGVSKRPESALRVLVEGSRRRFDLGRANGRYFLCMAGVGFDAAVVNAVPNRLKQRLGSTSYAFVGMRDLLSYEPVEVSLTVDGDQRELTLYWLLLGNTRSYGGVLDITTAARVDDGLLDAYVFEGRGLPWLATTALRLAARRHDNARGVTFQRVSTLEVTTPGLPVQIDGEYIGETPTLFEVASQVLDVILPPGKGERLFTE
jgi:YegS/Rv2252/BmrU family lipid kinase